MNDDTMLSHQDVESGIAVGDEKCLMELAGENIAVFSSSERNNYPLQCFKQWLNSDERRKNMKDPSFKTSVTAIFTGNYARVYCTQTLFLSLIF